MKKLVAALIVCLSASFGFADSQTNRLHLTLPTIGSPTWGQKVNSNFQILDSTVGALGASNTFSSTQTFNAYVQFNSTVNWQNLRTGTGQCLGINTSSNTVLVTCGSGGGGSGPTGQIVDGPYQSIPYYSVAGSSNVLSAIPYLTQNGGQMTFTSGNNGRLGFQSTDGTATASIYNQGSSAENLIHIGGTGTVGSAVSLGINRNAQLGVDIVAGHVKISSITWPDGTVQTSSPTVSGGGGGSGIVSPATFTWVNNFGLQISTLVTTSMSVDSSGINVQSGKSVGLSGQTNVRFFDADSSDNVQVQAPTSVSSYSLYLPGSQGSASSFLQNDGSGNLSWATVSGGGGGAGVIAGTGNLYDIPYVSVASSNTLAMSSNVKVFPSSVTILGAKPILSTSTLQSGATVYASSGTINTFNIGTSIKWPDGSVQVSSPPASPTLAPTGVAFGTSVSTIGANTNLLSFDNTTSSLYLGDTQANIDSGLSPISIGGFKISGNLGFMLVGHGNTSLYPIHSLIGNYTTGKTFDIYHWDTGDVWYSANGGKLSFITTTNGFPSYSSSFDVNYGSITFTTPLAYAQYGVSSNTTTIRSVTNALLATDASGVVISTTVNLAASNIGGNLPVARLNSGTSASGSTFWRGDGTWATPAGGGGASSLAVTTGTASGFNTVISSPTGVILADGSQMTVTAQGSATAYLTLNPSSVTLRGSNVINLQNSLQSGATFFVSSGTVNSAFRLGYVPDSSFTSIFPAAPMKPVLVSSSGLVTPSIMYQIHDPSQFINSIYVSGTPYSNFNSLFDIDANDSTGSDPGGLNALGVTVTGSQANSTMIAINTDVHTTGDSYNEWSRGTTAGGTVYVNKLEAAGTQANYAAWLKATGGTSNHAAHLEAGDLSLKNSSPTTGYFMIGQGVSAVPKWTNTIPSSMTITDIYTTYGENVSTLTIRSLTNAILGTDASGVAISTTINLGASNVGGNLPVSRLNSGTSASASTFWRGDGTWATPAGGAGDNLGNHIATMTVTAGYGLTSTTGTFSSTVNISSVATITALVLGTTNYASYGSSGTITPDATMGNNISITLTSSATINVPINAQDFEMFRYRIAQDAAGSRSITLGSGFAFGTDVSSATFSTAANKVDYLACLYYSATSKCHIVSPVIRGY